ncbi:hypothetical protein ABLB90_06825 [Photorhabdus bodei]|uniref:hypothetical protein n=1 Tax=Photorhabdus TaxID=29487 RepID=UPI001BD6B5AD|nr:hypothetical protein [Photorhabdus hainanensis]MBS9432255.1 hypothetical protein [Photorhabdus hainanensis]
MSSIKKILLVNDTRGTQEYLYRAFNEMGIKCDIATFGWPTINKIDNAMNFDPFRKLGLFGKPFRPLLNLYNVIRLDDYDVASYVHRISFIDKPHFLRYTDLPILRKKVGVMSYTGLGCDEISFIAGNKKLPYSPCNTCQKFDDPKHYCQKVVRPLGQKAIPRLNEYFDCAFSIGVEYSHVGDLFKNTVIPMPLPIDINEIPWMPAKSKNSGKINIIHTPSRPGFKGTSIVLEAIQILKQMRNDFEFQVVTGLPFSEYITTIKDADIIVDQVWSQHPGVNALWLLAMGKIVFSGNTDMAKEYFNLSSDCPIFDASPDPTLLAKKLNEAIEMKNTYSYLSEIGKNYVKQHHDHIKVASTYLKHWQTIKDIKNT